MARVPLIALLVLAGTAAVGGAQTPEPPAGQAPGRVARLAREPRAAAEVARMLDTYAIVQAQEALALNDDQYVQFVTRLKRLQDARRQGQRERNRMIAELRRLAGPQAPPLDEAALRERLRALRGHDERTALEMRKAYDALDEVLDLRQQARFRVFEETIERRKLDLLVRARERAARRGGTRP